MIGAFIRRGLLAGLLAGILAGLVGLLAGEPSIDAAVAIEEARAAAAPAGDGAGAHPEAAAEDSGLEISRTTQRIGLIPGTGLVGVAAGLLFGLVAAWAVGRVAGDAWTRSLKLGAVAAAALVLLPAVKYPPNPPAVGDPETVTQRTVLYLGMGLLGLLLVAVAWVVARQLARNGWASAPVRQVAVGTGLILAAALVTVGMPTVDAPPAPVPAELMWRFRLGSLATQLTLVVATAAGFGLLAARAERRPEARRAGSPRVAPSAGG